MSSGGWQDDVLGISAALGSFVLLGAYGVPIKLDRVQRTNVDPIVYQTYQAVSIFLCSWFVLYYVDLVVTWWGFVSGAIWVPSGVLFFVAIKCCGLSLAHSLWLASSLLMTLLFDLTVFDDEFNRWQLTIIAVVLFIVSAAIMAWIALHGIASSRKNFLSMQHQQQQANRWKTPAVETVPGWARDTHPSMASHALVSGSGSGSGSGSSSESASSSPTTTVTTTSSNTGSNSTTTRGNIDDDPLALSLSLPLLSHVLEKPGACTTAWLGSVSTQVFVGLGCAIVSGILNACLLLPLFYAPADTVGAAYFVSFGTGVLFVAFALDALYLIVYYISLKTLPSLYLNHVALPGLASGFLLVVGLWCSYYTTYYLPMFVAFPLVHLHFLGAALWGMLAFKEERDMCHMMSFFGWIGCMVVAIFLIGFVAFET